ncbi:hypothetical protein [Natronorubrum sp. A-ect3]|uniref:hypothetical protein n=1 Tax=Natronorubrum sp. A-ect3 TaxID=3242698 RepID=UPI00359CC423
MSIDDDTDALADADQQRPPTCVYCDLEIPMASICEALPETVSLERDGGDRSVDVWTALECPYCGGPQSLQVSVAICERGLSQHVYVTTTAFDALERGASPDVTDAEADR